MNNGMRIGELAKATGLTTKTIRYYELNRLLEEPRRADSGYPTSLGILESTVELGLETVFETLSIISGD